MKTLKLSWHGKVCALLVLLFSFLSFTSSLHESATIDEFRHLSTGVYYWQSGDLSFDSATPPLWKYVLSLPAYLAGARHQAPPVFSAEAGGWTPWLFANDFMKSNAALYTSSLQYARSINIIASCGLLIYLFRRIRRRFGPDAAIYGTSFLAFSPTMLAHSHYATTDVIVTLTITVMVFLLIDYLEQPTWPLLTKIATCFAISLLCKFSALLMLPPLLLALVLHPPALSVILHRYQNGIVTFFVIRSLLSILTSLAIVVAVLSLPYGARGVGARLSDMDLYSASLSRLAEAGVGRVPIPLPQSLVEGFDHQKADSDYAEFPSYFMGRWSADGFPFYYVCSFLIKESLPFVLMLILLLFTRRYTAVVGAKWAEMVLLWYLPVCLFVVLSFFNKLDVGVRYLLPAYPFFCYFYAQLYACLSERKCWRNFLVLMLVLHVISVVRVAPHYTAYFNELIGGSQQGHRYLIDSNLDWGQDLYGLKNYMRENGIDKIQLAYFGHAPPEFYGISYEPLLGSPKPGYAAVSASLLHGQPYLLTYLSPPFLVEFDYYRYMRKYEPIAQVGYSLMIYRINEGGN